MAVEMSKRIPSSLAIGEYQDDPIRLDDTESEVLPSHLGMVKAFKPDGSFWYPWKGGTAAIGKDGLVYL